MPYQERIRAFIALQPDADARESLSGIQLPFRMLTAHVKWEKSAHFHVTLKFLGDTTRGVLENYGRNLRESDRLPEPFTASIDRVGCFPNLRNPRIVWIGFSEPPDDLFRINELVEDAGELNGFERERKKFHPHVTIGRIKSPDGLEELQKEISTCRFEPFEFRFSAVSLMKSELRPTGAIHTELERIPLGQAAGLSH